MIKGTRTLTLLMVAFAACSSCAHKPSPAEEGLQDGLGEGLTSDPAETTLADERPAGGPAARVAPEQAPAGRPQDRCTAMTSSNAVRREAVVQTVDAGLGLWLGGVQVERVLEKRKFQGWRIQALHLANPCYANVDLRPGDVVTAINEKGPKQLEKPDTAQMVFISLKTAPAIEVSYLRDGKPRRIRIEITEKAP